MILIRFRPTVIWRPRAEVIARIVLGLICLALSLLAGVIGGA